MENPPTFHTVRSLANSLAKKAEESKEAIQKNNAHKSVDTQLIYQEGHDLPFDDAPIQFTAEQIGGGILSRLVTTNLKTRSWCSAIGVQLVFSWCSVGVQLVTTTAVSLVNGGA